MSNQHKDPSVRVIVDSLEDNKAEKISIISLKGKAEFAEFMVVASGRSNKHVDSVSEKVFRDLKTQKMYCSKPEGRPLCDWTVIDAGVYWPAPDSTAAAIMGPDGLAAGPHRLVWVDIV